MSLEAQVTALINNVTQLTNRVATQADSWNAAVNNAVNTANARINEYLQNARGEYPLPPNMIKNAYMTDLTDVRDNSGNVIRRYPTGFSAANCTIEAVHPFTKAFEGPYVSSRPANAVDNPELATKDNPFYFGTYNKGPRIASGGLEDGWGGITNGNILKITAQATNSGSYHKGVFFPISYRAATNQIRFRCYLKIVKGSRVGFGPDAGYLDNPAGYVITREQTLQHPQGWMYVDILVSTSQVTDTFGSNFYLGLPHLEESEVYLALPYAFIPAGARPGITTAYGEV